MLKIPCEIYSRITGYIQPISKWNPGKVQEFIERTMVEIKHDEN